MATVTHRPASGPLCFFTAVNPTDTVLNISCYKFVPLPDAAALRDVLQEFENNQQESNHAQN